MSTHDINRLNASVEFLKDKLPFTAAGFGLTNRAPNIICVLMKSNYNFLENMTKEIVIEEFIAMKDNFIELMSDAHIFLNYVKGKRIDYILYVDEIPVCEEINNELKNRDFIIPFLKGK